MRWLSIHVIVDTIYLFIHVILHFRVLLLHLDVVACHIVACLALFGIHFIFLLFIKFDNINYLRRTWWIGYFFLRFFFFLMLFFIIIRLLLGNRTAIDIIYRINDDFTNILVIDRTTNNLKLIYFVLCLIIELIFIIVYFIALSAVIIIFIKYFEFMLKVTSIIKIVFIIEVLSWLL